MSRVPSRVGIFAGLVAWLLMTGFGRVPAAQAAQCGFVLGFATLHNLIPSVVGDCLDNEQHNPVSGDALQHTTRGLLVWRKHPQAGTRNVTAFTDGYRSWVHGPYGVQERLNSQRFAWKANPAGLSVAPAVPSPLLLATS